MKKKYQVLVLLCSLLVVGIASVRFMAAAKDSGVNERTDSIPSKRDLRRSFFDKREILVVYAANDTMLVQKYKALLAPLSSRKVTSSWRSAKVVFKNATEVVEEELHSSIVFFVGAIDEHHILKKYIGQTPLNINKKEISIGNKIIANENALLSVGFYPSPYNAKIPFTFLTGTNAQDVFNVFSRRVKDNGQGFYRQHLDYEVFRNTQRIVMGNFDTHWKTDTTTFFDFSTGTTLLSENNAFSVVNHQNAIKKSDVSEIVEHLERSRKAITTFLSTQKKVSKITYHFYRNTEEKGLVTGNTDQSHITSLTNSVHTISNDMYKGNEVGMDNALLVQQLVGVSNKAILTRGLPVYFTKSWQVRGYQYWASRLMESGNTLTVDQLLDNEFLAMESSLIRDCLAGAFTEFLLEVWGKEKYLSNYKNFKLNTAERKQLENAWQQYMVAYPKKHPKEKVRTKKLPYVKGFNFAHEGYSIYNGYGSKKATESLVKQQQLGSNAMAIVPYSGIDDINTPAPFHFSNNAGGENDEAVVHSVATARNLGMYTVLKPQIFVGGSWPGGIHMATNADWDKFFEHYYRWIRHYAFLAEIHDIDALCIGVEFTKATLLRPDAWRKIIKLTRGLYSGKLTYAANWGEEFENIEFWDELDFIGLNSYYPLSKKDNPTNAEMAAKFDTIKTKIRKVYNRFKKPIVFTEIGFRSIDTPWKNPHAEADESINQKMQQRCYEIIFKGIENEPWCQGILWWKYPSYLEYRGVDNNAFTPNNKLADETVRKWFTK